MPIDVEEATRQADALMQGAVEQFSKPLIIPTSEPVDLTRAYETLNRAETTGGEQARTVDEATKLFTEATTKEKEALGKEGEARAAKAIAEGARQEEEASAYRYARHMFGMDLAPDSEIANAAAVQRELRSTMNAKLDRVNALKSVSFFDDPIDYFLNSFELPGAVEDYNITATKVNNLQDTIDKGLESARSAGELHNRGIPTITASMATANANIALAEAAKKKADADEKLAQVNVDFATKKLSTDLALAGATRETSQLELANERMKYETLINAVRLADSHGARLETASKMLHEIAEKANLQQVILDGYDRNVGNPKGTTNVLTFNRMPAPERENITAIGLGSAGTNPYEFLKNFKHVGPLLSPETGRLLNFVQDEEAKVKRDPTVEPKVQEQRVAKYLKERIEAEMNRPSQSKIFVEMSPAKMIASGAVPLGSKLEEVLAPLANTSGSVTTNAIIETIAKAYPNPTEAGIVGADYYKKNMELRNKSLNMSLMNMKAPDSYKVPGTSITPTTGLGMGGGAITNRSMYDLTRPEEFTKYLLLMQTQKRMRELEGDFMMPIGLEDMTPEQLQAEAKRRSDIQKRVDQARKETPQPDIRRLPNVEEGILNEPPANPAERSRQPKRAGT